MGSPIVPWPDLSRTWLLLRMKNVPLRLTRLPRVPEQHVIVLPLVVLSVELPPLVPNLMGINWEVWLSLGYTTVKLALPLAADVEAFTMNALGEGNEAGAVYLPVLSMVPTVELPPCTPLTLHIAVV